MPEMMIEGIPQAEELRDFFYAHMRGGHLSGKPRAEAAADVQVESATNAQIVPSDFGGGGDRGEVAELLREIRDQLQRAADRLEKAS